MALFVVASCSKSEEEPKTETESCQLTQASVTSGGETITNIYQYDGGGKITTVNSSSVFNNGTPNTSTYAFTYTADSFSDGDKTYALDAMGRIKSSTRYYKVNNINYIATFNYTYNSDGYITEVKNSSTNEVTKFTWTAGNLTKVEDSYMVGGVLSTNVQIYDYSTEVKPDNFYSDVPDLPVPNTYIFKFMGKQSKNLISKVRYEGGSTAEILSYGKDSNGNITSLTEKEDGTAKTFGIYQFKYKCN